MKNKRREFLQKIGLGTAGLGVVASTATLTSCNASENKQGAEINDAQFLQIGDDIANAETGYGKIRGYQLNGIYTFLGIPYGADTSGKNRFMPPERPEPWSDVKPTIWWGNSAPQIMDNRYANPHASFADHWNYDDLGEDCLKLNVWTPGIADEKKRPVLVWIHGGGFTNGNAIEQDGYHGENLSKQGDIVFVSINHRLGPMGFTDLSGVGGEKYKSSGNVGMLDIIAALDWVQENITNFGGDPNNVTIIGQSGGGSKVTATLAMPSSQGKVHKAVALSGSMLKGIDPTYSKKLGGFVLQEAGLSALTLDELQQVSWREYLDIAYRALEKMRNESTGSSRTGFAPVADGVYLPSGEFFSASDSQGSEIPLLICTTFHEWNPTRASADLDAIDVEGVIAKLKPRFGEQTEQIVKAYQDNFPGKRPAEIWALILSNRLSAVNTANAKSTQNAPVYMAWFGWEPNLYNGRMRAFHCIDICFWFSNTDRMYTHTGGGTRPRMLSEKMSQALVSYMETGNPNAPKLPEWPAYTIEKGETMVLNDTCEVQNDPDRAARESLI